MCDPVGVESVVYAFGYKHLNPSGLEQRTLKCGY